MRRLTLRVSPGVYAICRLEGGSGIPEWPEGGFVSITRTADEVSVVCEQRSVPEGVRHEGGWRLLQAEGPFDFSETGVLHSLTAPLAEAGVPVFAVSTFDTDYLMVKEGDFERAAGVLRSAGHVVPSGRTRGNL